mgnify:CR=1 FL=1
MAKFGSDSKFGTGKDANDGVSKKVSEFLNQYDEIIVEGQTEADILQGVLGIKRDKIKDAGGRKNVFTKIRKLCYSGPEGRVLAITDGENEGIYVIANKLKSVGCNDVEVDPPLVRVNGGKIDIWVMGLPEKCYEGCTESVMGRILEIEKKGLNVDGDCKNDKKALWDYVCGVGSCSNEGFRNILINDNKEKIGGELLDYITRSGKFVYNPHDCKG